MTSLRLVIESTTHHWRTNVAVMLGVAAAVSVLAGALLVGESVRASLRDIAVGRLGKTEVVVASTGFFRDALAEKVHSDLGTGSSAVPLIAANGFVTHESSGRRAGGVVVYGVDDRFWAFHGVATRAGVFISPALASELGASTRDTLLVRLQKPSA